MRRPHTPPQRAARPLHGGLGLSGCCLLAAAIFPGVAAGQEPPATPLPAVTDSTPTAPERGASPGGAFLRAVLLPGWGHASIRAYNRGAFYFVAESATGWAMFKARNRLAEARARVAFREQVVRADQAAQGVTNPTELAAVLDADETLQDLKALEESRRQQREDWTALEIFLLFLSGADAYVSAHLEHFPKNVDFDATPVGNGRMELSVSFSFPR